MIEIPVYKLDGKKAGTMKVDEESLGGTVRPQLLKQAYVMYHANHRQGSARTKSRGMKEGSTKKLYRQKGTGNARMGTRRTNIRTGGGVAFAKKPKSWRQSMPAKMRRLATRNALLSKIQDEEIRVVEKFDFDQPKTKRMAEILNALKIDKSCLLALHHTDLNTALSARNLQEIQSIQIEQLNAYDLLSRRFLLVEKEALSQYLSPEAGGKQEEAA
ncbi:MAG: 50S ribosomal protein L4 [Phycisphaeraceae bacterium]|nr:50S ribosomal protein L4 [Phycisphaeraceae bacterium]